MSPTTIATWMLASYIAGETFSLSLEQLIIKDPKLPKSFNNLKVCFISDIHHGRFSSQLRLKKMVKKINQTQPDLILLGGDYLQTFRRSLTQQEKDLKQLLAILATLKPPALGIYAVLGNHDYGLPTPKVIRAFAQAHIKVLHNQGVVLRRDKERIFLSGVADSWYGQPNLAQANKLAKKSDFKILLAHQPNFIDEITSADGINFVLAGHTHGAQVNMFRYTPLLPKKISRWEYRVGLIETPQARMLVSPGIGTVPPYFRLGSPPKIHLLTFKAAPRVKHANL